MAAPQFKLNVDDCTDEGKRAICEAISIVENFPKPGLRFKELTGVLGNYIAFQAVVDALVNRYRTKGVTGVSFLPQSLTRRMFQGSCTCCFSCSLPGFFLSIPQRIFCARSIVVGPLWL